MKTKSTEKSPVSTNQNSQTPLKNSSARTGLKARAALRRVDKRIPMLAGAATTKAYHRALASGSKVLIAEAGELREISPDGTKRVIKKIEPAVKMRKGQIIKIK